MKRFAAWLFSDWRLVILAPMILTSVFIVSSHGSSFVTAIELGFIAAEDRREQAVVDRAILEMAPPHERVQLVDAVLAKN